MVAALVVGGLVATTRRDGGGGLTADDVVRASLIIAWAAAGVTLARQSSALGRIVLAGATVAGVAFLAGAMAAMKDGDNLAVVAVHVLAVGLLPAVGLHFVLSLADGVLGSRGRVATVAVGYAGASVAGLLALAADRSMPGWVIWSEATIAVLVGAGPAHRRYLESTGLARQRLQWLGCAVTVAGEVALVIGALRILVDWPDQAAVVAAAGTVLVPLALIASATPLVTQADRLLVTTVSATGLTGVVVGVYLVIVVGLGRTPTDSERSLVVLSMAAAGVAALVYLPARERLTDAANRLVYGERHAPDETIRTFGNRLSRGRYRWTSCCCSSPSRCARPWPCASAEIWTGSEGRYERAVVGARPGAPATCASTRARCRSSPGPACRAPHGWPSGCPSSSLVAATQQLRVAPISHSGELLG